MDGCSPAQSPGVFGAIARMGRRWRRPRLGGDAVRLEGVLRRRPRAQLGGRLVEGQADGAGEGGGDHAAHEQAVPPDVATACLVTELGPRGARWGRWGALGVSLVADEAATGPAIGAPEDAHTRPPALVPRALALSQHPGQGRSRIGPQAGACNAGPAPGVGHQNGRDTTREPGTRPGGHPVARTLLATRLVNGVDTGADTGGRLSHDPSGLPGQSGAWPYPQEVLDRVHLTSPESTSYPRMRGAGPAVSRGRMVPACSLELERSTQRPHAP